MQFLILKVVVLLHRVLSLMTKVFYLVVLMCLQLAFFSNGVIICTTQYITYPSTP
nr:MAG TPA: hypothetical protein [Caudoviricetes sp.]